jgi:hypothetical protein
MVNLALRPRLQHWNPGHPKTPKTHTQDTPKTLFSTSACSAAKLFWRGCCASDRLQAVASISRKPSPLLVDPTPKRAGVAVRAVIPATVTTRQPIGSRRRSGISSWKRDGLEVGGVFFLDCVAASSMVQAEAGRQSRQRGDMAADGCNTGEV